MVLGFVMGVFLAALYLVCIAVLSNKLQEQRNWCDTIRCVSLVLSPGSSAPRELLDFYCASSIGIRNAFSGGIPADGFFKY